MGIFSFHAFSIINGAFLVKKKATTDIEQPAIIEPQIRNIDFVYYLS
jgi:hypothetical protein